MESNSIFALTLVHKKKFGRSEKMNLEPVGTASAISDVFVLSTAHHLKKYDDSFALIKEVELGDPVALEDLILLDFVQNDAEEDWIIFRRRSLTFEEHLDICPESELPKPKDPVIIKHYPVCTITTRRLRILDGPMRTMTTLKHYENRMPDTNTGSSTLIPVVLRKDLRRSSREEKDHEKDAIIVSSGLPIGSCGAPYLNSARKVVAQHIESCDDSEQGSNERSYNAWSRGYVLCRLPKFMKWYEENVSSMKDATL
jgi:hypothetical protein